MAKYEEVISYEAREVLKQQAYTSYLKVQINELELFEKLSFAWWHRVSRRVDLDVFRRHLVRGQILNDDIPPQEILEKYPPATGKIKIAPGMSDYYPSERLLNFLKKEELGYE